MAGPGRSACVAIALASLLGETCTTQAQTVFKTARPESAASRFNASNQEMGLLGVSFPSLVTGRGVGNVDGTVDDLLYGEPIPERASWILLGGGLAIALSWRARRALMTTDQDA